MRIRAWLEVKGTMVGFWTIIVAALAFSAAPIVF
jgi:hypothetical protein